MREDVARLLSALGVAVSGLDTILDFVIRGVEETIRNETNQQSVPDGLKAAAVYQAVGQYLLLLKGAGRLEGFDLEAAVKQVQEGDTSVTYAVGEGTQTPERRLDTLLNWLAGYGREQLARYRRLEW